MEGFREEYTTQVALILEFAEHGGGGASQGIGEVGGIAEIDHQRQTVDNNEDPTAELMPDSRFLPMQGQQHQHDIGDVGDEDGCRVEHQSSLQHLCRQTI